ncbi:hypothetical protein OG372_36815 [Streptomyces sp. NBC_01020]|uniref:hypothetical protein n=1 Tax=Streptomyces sp. NBC_01020 TaxID=2903722 RepID=UPI00386A75F6|nr:hypothetical protein OG372_36815 [Streptomyces sp. NBC_01020]
MTVDSGYLRCGSEVVLQSGSGFEGVMYPNSGCWRSLLRLYSTSMKRKTSARASARVARTLVPISDFSTANQLSAAALS